MTNPEVQSSEYHFDGFYKVRRDDLGNGVFYDILEMKANAIHVISKTKEGLYLVNKEYRPAVKKEILSGTSGLILPNEEPIAAAKRELLEETGYTSNNFTFLGTTYPFPGVTGQTITYFLANHVEKLGSQNLEAGEWITTYLLSLQELQQQIENGVPVDGVFLSGLYFTTKIV